MPVKTAKPAKVTAHEAFVAKHAKVNDQIARLQQLVALHAQQEYGAQLDWGYAGSLGHVSAKLAELIEFLGG